MPNSASATPPLSYRLREALERISRVLRSEEWASAHALGLTPTQLHILIFLAARHEMGARITGVARQLGISQPTATDSVAALIRKGLAVKEPPGNSAGSLAITPAGEAIVAAAGAVTSASAAALATLPLAGQQALLVQLVKVIRALQVEGVITGQRMCVTCRHFRPFAHKGAANPHHCAFVNAAFGSGELRIDCREHETADPSFQAATWKDFELGSAPLQASN